MDNPKFIVNVTYRDGTQETYVDCHFYIHKDTDHFLQITLDGGKNVFIMYDVIKTFSTQFTN